jgi:hypothetical protein
MGQEVLLDMGSDGGSRHTRNGKVGSERRVEIRPQRGGVINTRTIGGEGGMRRDGECPGVVGEVTPWGG